MQALHVERVIRKLRALSPERIVEVEDFIDFLQQRDENQRLIQATMAASESVLKQLWDNPDDANDAIP